jgi:hypothetical protein
MSAATAGTMAGATANAADITDASKICFTGITSLRSMHASSTGSFVSRALAKSVAEPQHFAEFNLRVKPDYYSDTVRSPVCNERGAWKLGRRLQSQLVPTPAQANLSGVMLR